MADPAPPERTTRHLVQPGAEPFFFPGGPAGCLLLHGLSSSPYVVRELGVHLHAAGVTVAAPLLAGHGTTPEDLRTKTWADWVASAEAGLAQLQAHGCRRVVLAGLSLGGAISLFLAARDPDAYAGLITMSAPVWIPPLLQAPLEALGGPMPYFRTGFTDIADPAADARQLTYDRVPLATGVTLIDLLAHVRAGLPRVTTPALIIYARRDHLVHPMNSMHIYSTIASAHKRLAVLHRGAHTVTVDYDKARVFHLATEFVAKLPS
ncbi:MAG TPA: alpha/beta fold hydrolase [Chloroflexia bacterium]|nr:alpha/beta fold hydrolase [Chloroflexia bacterium]